MSNAELTSDAVTRLLPKRDGHFRLESGHHGDVWLDLELLCMRPQAVRPLALEIAERLADLELEAICGPLIEGAFIALTVAEQLGIPFTYAERLGNPETDSLYSVRYRIPRALRPQLRRKRVAIVNDVINAGSAVRGTFFDLESCGAKPMAIGSLAVLGDQAAAFAAEKRLVLATLAFLPNTIWAPARCPLCAGGVPLDEPV